jgi:hypothetical protein
MDLQLMVLLGSLEHWCILKVKEEEDILICNFWPSNNKNWVYHSFTLIWTSYKLLLSLDKYVLEVLSTPVVGLCGSHSGLVGQIWSPGVTCINYVPILLQSILQKIGRPHKSNNIFLYYWVWLILDMYAGMPWSRMLWVGQSNCYSQGTFQKGLEVEFQTLGHQNDQFSATKCIRCLLLWQQTFAWNENLGIINSK